MSVLEPSPQTSTPVVGKPAVDEALCEKLLAVRIAADRFQLIHTDIDTVQEQLAIVRDAVYDADRYIMDCWIGFNQRRGKISPFPKSTLSLSDLGL